MNTPRYRIRREWSDYRADYLWHVYTNTPPNTIRAIFRPWTHIANAHTHTEALAHMDAHAGRRVASEAWANRWRAGEVPLQPLPAPAPLDPATLERIGRECGAAVARGLSTPAHVERIAPHD